MKANEHADSILEAPNPDVFAELFEFWDRVDNAIAATQNHDLLSYSYGKRSGEGDTTNIKLVIRGEEAYSHARNALYNIVVVGSKRLDLKRELGIF